jgi:hypothetical protein
VRTPTDNKGRVRTPAGGSLGEATTAGDSLKSSTPRRVQCSSLGLDVKPAQPSFDHVAAAMHVQPRVDDGMDDATAATPSQETQSTLADKQQQLSAERTQQSSVTFCALSSPEEKEGEQEEQGTMLLQTKEPRRAQRSTAPPPAQHTQGRRVDYVKDVVPLITGGDSQT